jgi:2-polyprenyl-3-methyl-5-hydroxy-6-metoxy-1,4-benzoquinol methylase
MEKKDNYYDFERHDLLQFIPPDLHTYLDIGCGSGNLGKIIKQRQNCQVHGIELDKQAALIAESKLDKVYNGFIEDYLEVLPPGYFGCIIMADVLEHLKNPALVLQKLLRTLKSDGVIFISIPNFCHYSVIEKILWNSFYYEPEGILDNTHISFIAKGAMVKMLTDLNFQISVIFSPRFVWKINNELISILNENNVETGNFLEEAHNFQYYIQAKKIPEKINFNNRSISLILTLTDNPEDNRLSFEKIIKYTHLPFKLIVIDKYSAIGQLKDLTPENTIVISGESSVPVSLNQALTIADGDYILILTADSYTGPGYLESMLEKFNFFENTGVVAPLSNNGSSNQKVDKVDYDINTLENLEEFTSFIKTRMPQFVNFKDVKYTDSSVEIRYVDSFCMLLPKSLIETIGGFDTRLENNFADDFCLRANLTGFKIIVDRDVFVHNNVKEPVNSDNRDLEIFKTKWSISYVSNQITLKGSKNDIFFPLVQNQGDDFFEQLEKSDDKALSSITKNLILDLLFQNKIESYYKVICAYLIAKNYTVAMEYLSNLSKLEKINKDICILFSYTLGQLNDQKMSSHFKEKYNEITDYSTLHEKLKMVYDMLPGFDPDI